MQRNEQMYHQCMQHMGRHVKVDMADQRSFYGFMENVDAENVYLIVLEMDGNNNGHGHDHGHGHHHGHHDHGYHHGNDQYQGHGYHQWHGHNQGNSRYGGLPTDQRVFGGYGYGGPGFGYGYGPGWGWRRLVLPLTALAAISLLY